MHHKQRGFIGITLLGCILLLSANVHGAQEAPGRWRAAIQNVVTVLQHPVRERRTVAKVGGAGAATVAAMAVLHATSHPDAAMHAHQALQHGALLLHGLTEVVTGSFAFGASYLGLDRLIEKRPISAYGRRFLVGAGLAASLMVGASYANAQGHHVHPMPPVEVQQVGDTKPSLPQVPHEHPTEHQHGDHNH